MSDNAGKPEKKPVVVDESEAGGKLVQFEDGSRLWRGPAHNHVPGPGRPRNEFKRRMQELASDEEVLAYLEECLKGEHGANPALRAHEHVSAHGYGKPSQDIQVGGETGLRILVVREVDELEGAE